MSITVSTYADAAHFLRDTETALESNEAANSLMLGVCGQLVRHPERIESPPCLKSVKEGSDLILAAMMTPPHNLVVYGHQGDIDGATRALVDDVAGEGWSVPGVFGPSEVAEGLAARWAEVTGIGFDVTDRQLVYELRQVIVPVPERGRLRLAHEADTELAAQWRTAFHTEIFGATDPQKMVEATRFRIEQGDIFLWEDGQPVSIAMKTRPTRNGISVSLVYTPPELRRRGYATACVGELSRLLLDAGLKFCALFADAANATSNHIYQNIGYRPVCDHAVCVLGNSGRPWVCTAQPLRIDQALQEKSAGSGMTGLPVAADSSAATHAARVA